MGRVFVEHLSGKAYCCKYCRTHLAKVEELLSKVRSSTTCARCGFQASHSANLPSTCLVPAIPDLNDQNDANWGLPAVIGAPQA